MTLVDFTWRVPLKVLPTAPGTLEERRCPSQAVTAQRQALRGRQQRPERRHKLLAQPTRVWARVRRKLTTMVYPHSDSPRVLSIMLVAGRSPTIPSLTVPSQPTEAEGILVVKQTSPTLACRIRLNTSRHLRGGGSNAVGSSTSHGRTRCCQSSRISRGALLAACWRSRSRALHGTSATPTRTLVRCKPTTYSFILTRCCATTK
mmetsp:Transcript_41818/g.111432  ORF Transcript_41818/g.111432 Transcript_41818/m.111432 type:complete len:204 (-) Transcript_41818:821-1432(-)